MRLIDTDAVKLPKGFFENVNNVPKFYEWLNTLPTIEPNQGKWELVDEAEPRRYGCSECKRLSYTQDNYCSHCGAKMKKRSFLINWSESEGYCDYE